MRIALVCGVKLLTAFFKCHGKLLGAAACHELGPVTLLVWLEAVLLDLRLENLAIQRNLLLDHRLLRLWSRLLYLAFFVFSLLFVLLFLCLSFLRYPLLLLLKLDLVCSRS